MGNAATSSARFWSRLVLGAAAAAIFHASPAWARKTNQPVYEDPYDIAAGGASLTKASKEGMLFANPALLPQGGKFHRWAGATFTLLTNKESVDTARTILNNARSGKKSSSGQTDEEKKAAEQKQSSEFVDKVFKDPVRLGWGVAISWLTNNFGLGIISRFEPDIRAKKFGASGLPEVQFRAESYHGAALGTGIKTPFRWLLLGVTAKYLYVAEPDVSVEVTDSTAIAQFQNPNFVQNLTSHNKGVGFDAGSLLFFQGSWVDFSLAGKVDDVGNTKLSGPSDTPKELKQVSSVGAGLTLHTGADALHFSADYRDLGNAYGDPMFKRVYAGTKLMLRTYLGLATGYYNGSPSYGAEIDLLLLRLAATTYTRELGDHPGVDPRHIYMVSLSTGF